MAEYFDILIIGAGHGGAQAAAALRQAKFTGTIGLAGDEQEMPYERPPLSKEYLAGEKPFERILIRPASFWAQHGIELLTGTQVVGVEPDARKVITASGGEITYGQLIWSAGGKARRLSCAGHDLIGVHSVRNRADVNQIMADLPLSRRVAVIGGGYIGLEAAAVLSKMGKDVVVFEAHDRVLARVAGEPLSRFYEAEHRGHGVDIRLNAVVDRIEGADGRACGVRLADGEIIPCDMVIVGIGIVPEVGPLIEAGAEGGNGVKVDAYCRTSLPNVFAIGDCALHENAFANGAMVRLESVQNANDMASTVAKAIVGVEQAYHTVPWFWSIQYDLRLQTVGLSAGYDQTVLRGDMAARSFSVIYLRSGRVIALDCVNATRDYVQGRQLVVAGAVVSAEELSTTPNLKDLKATSAF